MTPDPLFSPLRLPNGSVLPNRLAKAAMEENLCDADHAPSPALQQLYATWSRGGAGLLITGNVMIDRRALTGPGGVVLEDDAHLDRFRAWARSASQAGGQVWMQINHPGRQVMASMGQPVIAPSAIAVQLPGLKGAFPQPRAMGEEDLADVIDRFARTARLASEAGFHGVEIHAAHGYLLSQFLSPLANQRQDRWGGSLENRARLLLEVVRAVRATVPRSFGVGVKLNSADFQRGGFRPDEAGKVLTWLNDLDVDLVELSGGSYESPAMRGLAQDSSTARREAYFLEFAARLQTLARMPLMVTGGIRRRPVADEVLAAGVDLVGLASGLAQCPDLPERWRRGEPAEVQEVRVDWARKSLAAAAASAIVKHWLHRLAAGQAPGRPLPAWWALLRDQLRMKRLTRQYRAWMAR